MKHQFNEGDFVTLTINYPTLGLCAGSQGRVWALYATELPSYEVTFCDAGGEEFDMVVSEDELAVYPASAVMLSEAA